MAGYGLAFYRDFARQMALVGQSERVDIGFRRQGYLFISDRGGSAQMETNFRLQEEMGVEVELLQPTVLRQRFPSLSISGIDLAVLSDHDGWIDPYAALIGFRHKAIELGARYRKAQVTGLIAEGPAVRKAILADGSTVEGDVFVNAAGAWCTELAATVGLELPVEPMSRESYFFRCSQPIEALPFIKTESDLAFRPEGGGYVGGVPDWDEPSGWNFNVSPSRFEEVVWPARAAGVDTTPAAYWTIRLFWARGLEALRTFFSLTVFQVTVSCMPRLWVGAWQSSLFRVVMPVLILVVSVMNAFGQGGPTGKKASSDNPKADSVASAHLLG